MELELGEIFDAKKGEGDAYMAEIEVSLQNFKCFSFVISNCKFCTSDST